MRAVAEKDSQLGKKISNIFLGDEHDYLFPTKLFGARNADQSDLTEQTENRFLSLYRDSDFMSFKSSLNPHDLKICVDVISNASFSKVIGFFYQGRKIFESLSDDKDDSTYLKSENLSAEKKEIAYGYAIDFFSAYMNRIGLVLDNPADFIEDMRRNLIGRNTAVKLPPLPVNLEKFFDEEVENPTTLLFYWHEYAEIEAYLETQNAKPSQEKLDALWDLWISLTRYYRLTMTKDELSRLTFHSTSENPNPREIIERANRLLKRLQLNLEEVSGHHYEFNFLPAGLSEDEAQDEELMRPYKYYVDKCLEINRFWYYSRGWCKEQIPSMQGLRAEFEKLRQEKFPESYQTIEEEIVEPQPLNELMPESSWSLNPIQHENNSASFEPQIIVKGNSQEKPEINTVQTSSQAKGQSENWRLETEVELEAHYPPEIEILLSKWGLKDNFTVEQLDLKYLEKSEKVINERQLMLLKDQYKVLEPFAFAA